ncbi:dynamin family protein [Pseudonocardia sediminis]|uniref:Dynamin family protein n=1 Tax=Pseudonocardia sediminis TaxID=1397368 RepID=A0A4Q7URK8_PSEST|nr:dynamin family protein [Pseudonocardia sediminis]RZT84325.1 dynamin family protein [Pseudonocardia sediminis]
MPATPSAAAKHALETLDMTVKGARAYDREDLADRLRAARRLLEAATVTVHVVGEFKQGKSSLVNALLTAPVCPVDDDIATAVPTEVRYAAELAASASFESAPGSGGPGWTEAISPSDIAAYASESGNPGNTRRLRSVTVGISRQLLSTGLVLIDTPGVGGLGSTANATAMSSLPQSHAVLFVTDASQELTAAELRFLRTVRELCPTLLLVLTKTDLYPQWQRILDLDQGHLRRKGITVDAVAVSSEIRALAAKDADQELNNESGFPELVRRINDVLAGSERIAVDSVVTHLGSALGQMEVAATARRDALLDPENAAELVATLTAAKESADALRERSSKWQLLLNDGFADIASDVDFDLRDRARRAMHEAEAAIDEGDPAKNWEEFEQWFRQRLAGEALENYALFVRRAKEVANTVGEHFDLAESEIVTAREVSAPVELLDTFTVDSAFVEKKAKGAGMAAFQKAYGGFLMFTMLTHMAALAIPAPFGLITGALMGRAGLKDERRRQLEKRRSEAKAAVRRFVDEFQMQVGKDSRDAIRHVQRELRTAWTERVSELQRSAAAGLAAAQESARTGESDVGARERIANDLASLAMLRARLDDLAGHLERVRGEPVTAGEGAPR